MENDKIYELYTTSVLKAQINAFNEGFEMGEKLAKENYERK